MATEIKFKDGPDVYKNQVDINIYAEGNIAGPDAETIYNAMTTIAEVVEKYYHLKKPAVIVEGKK